MKKQIMRALLGFALLTTPAASAYAQAGRSMNVHIPFDFVVAGKQLPAGDYSVRRVSKDSESALVIQSEDGRSATALFTNAGAQEPSRAELTFRQRGESYFLASVSIPGAASVRQVPPSKSETRRVRELIEQAKADGSGGDSAKTVTIRGSVQ
jgi:hypothetical protein